MRFWVLYDHTESETRYYTTERLAQASILAEIRHHRLHHSIDGWPEPGEAATHEACWAAYLASHFGGTVSITEAWFDD